LRSVSRAEFEWQRRQAVLSPPSLSRLRASLKKAGFARVRLSLDEGREWLWFTLWPTPRIRKLAGDRLLTLLIRSFRRGGFEVGFEELGFHSTEPVRGTTLTGPIGAVAERGAPHIEA
jgi:hypothetical protein